MGGNLKYTKTAFITLSLFVLSCVSIRSADQFKEYIVSKVEKVIVAKANNQIDTSSHSSLFLLCKQLEILLEILIG